MKKFLALILTLGFVGNAFAVCCGRCNSGATVGKKPSCYRTECRKVKVCAKKQITFACPFEAKHPKSGKMVAVHQE